MKIYGVISEEVYPLFEYNKPYLDALDIPYHFEEIDLEVDGPSHYKTYKYGLCLYKRCHYYADLLESLDDGEVVLFTDLDVVPLGDYNELPTWLDGKTDICFMREHYGRPKSVNCGFIVVRKSDSTVQLFRAWLARCKRKFDKTNYLFDQGEMQWLLRTNIIKYTTFPLSAVSGYRNRIYASTIAYHAINTGRPKQSQSEVVDNEKFINKISAMDNARKLKKKFIL